MPMQRGIRISLARVCFALGMASFLSHLWLFFQYHSTRPREPHRELGRVHASNNHGSYVYLTDEEATELGLLDGAFGLGILIGLIMVPKESTPGGIHTELGQPSRRGYLVLAIVITCYLAAIIFAGPRIAAFAVSRGIVLSWG
jgi:hypothetical protein